MITIKKPTHNGQENPIVSRITDLLIQKKKSQKELVEHLGLRKNTYTEWKAGRMSSYRQYIDEIASFLDVSPTYLLRGEDCNATGTMLSKQEQELIKVYRHLSTESKEKIFASALALEDLENNNTK